MPAIGWRKRGGSKPIKFTKEKTMSIEAMKLALEALEGLINKTSGQAIYSFMETERRIAMSACVGIKEALSFLDGEAQNEVCRTNTEKAKHMSKKEPVAWITEGGNGWLRWHNKNDTELNKNSIPLYKHPKRKPLTDAEIALISAECSLRTPSDIYFARAIEAAHGIKGKNK